MAKKWLDNFKEKASDWYYDGDQFYLRTILNPVVDIVNGIGSLGQVGSETFTPVYSDVIAANNLFNNGLSAFKSGKYLKGSTEMIGAPFLGAALMAIPDGMDSPIKAATKLDEPLHIFTSKQMGQKAGRGRPASNINEATGKPITMRDVLEAIKNNGRTVYENTSEEAIKSAAIQHAADTRSKYLQVLDALERKANKVKSDWDRKRGLYQTKKLTGEIETSNLPIVTTYLEENILSTFKPSKKAIKKGDFDSYYKELLDHISNLGYDIETKASQEAINKIALNTSWGKQVPGKKQGGILNYLTYFS